MARSVVQVSGHIIDSLILPKILDLIISLGAEFEILEIQIGRRRADRSDARIQVEAPTPALLEQVLAKIKEHGALPLETKDESVGLRPAPADGVFPDYFYATTNLATWVRVKGQWVEVAFPEMDCGIRVDVNALRAECVPMHRVKKDDLIVVGLCGVKIVPPERHMPR
ncbi:MAG TPA: TIGR00300 family protein, partial [Methylomirabilota bacterium]|nr:TIGR00300 family protein [Methylomirabilota bacterium]